MRTSSGMKRGLATVAVSALAVTGLPFLTSSASANPITDQLGAQDLAIVAPIADSSIKNDGANTTVHLLAVGGSDVKQVRFEYVPQGGTVTPIATVSRAHGVFSTEWAPPAQLINDPGTEIRATGLSSVGTPIPGVENSVVTVVRADTDSVDIANAPGSAVGVFQQPYGGGIDALLGAVSGTTSDVTGPADVELVAPTGGAFLTADVAEDPASGAETRSWSGVVDFGNSYDFTGSPDEAVVHAGVGDSDDAEAVTLYEQTIAQVPQLQPISVQQGSTATARVQVLDQQGKPVAGAQVVQEGGPTQYTNSQGIAEFAGLAGSDSGTTYTFTVNTTDDPAYESAIDFQRTVTVTEYAGEPQTLTASSADGAAFDDDEFALGDIQVTIKDQNGNALAGQALVASWHVVPFDGSAAQDVNATVSDNGDGTYDVSFPGGSPSGEYTLSYFINTDGTPGEGPTDPSGEDLVVKAGDAEVKWKDGAAAQAAAGTTATFQGTLALEDGTGLGGRDVVLSWAKNPAGNAVVAAQSAQPAGTTRNGDTGADAVTQADGTFGVAIADPSDPDADELDGTLSAGTAITPPAPLLDVDFLKNAGPSTPADITVDVQNLIDGKATPGRPVDLDINVQNSDDVDLTDFPVTVEVDHGFLSPDAETAADLVADPAPAQDGLYGEWKSEGTEKEYTTDDSGDTGAVVAIEDDAAFATSSTVTTTVTVTAGNVSKTVPVTFTSEDPLNGGAVRVELADDQSVSVLPKAPTDETVAYNLFVEDQFGNLVDNEDVTLTDDLAGATINGADTNEVVQSQLENEAPALTLASDAEGSQTVSADWDVDSNIWIDGDTGADGFQAARDTDTTTVEGDAAPVDWYDVDFATSNFAMSHSGGKTLKVGATTTVTYKAVDQNGEPIEGLQVNFFRAGPDDQQDGEGKPAVLTNAAGVAQYTFQGTRAGSAVVAAVVRDATDTIIPEAAATHTVKFGTQKRKINARLAAKSKGNKDILRVRAPKAARGAKVVFYAEINGEVVKVGKAKLNRNGKVSKKVRDRNGKKVTAYAAIVRGTKRTLQDETNVRRVR